MSADSKAKETSAFQRLTQAERTEARAIARGFNVRDSVAMTSFGVKPQEEMGELTDPIMKMVATKDTGEAGKALTALMVDIKSLNADSLSSWIEPAIARLPVVGRFFSVVQQFMAQYEKIAVKIDRTTAQLDMSKNLLNGDIALLDRLYAENLRSYRGLLTYVAAGELKLEDLRAEQAELQAEAAQAADALSAQEAYDLGNAATRLERRLYDLKLSATVALQTGPQIRLVQNGDQALVEKIQSSILTTIPLWKQQVIIAVSLFRQRKAIDLQRHVTDTTNEMLEKNAQMLQRGSADAARESERGIVELATLQSVNQKLIDTIAETLRIQDEARQQRRAAEVALDKMHQDLKDALAKAQQMQDGTPPVVSIPREPAGDTPAPPEHDDLFVENLTPREVEVLRLIVQEKSDNDIAAELVVSVRTVQSHERSIYGKLGVNSRRDAARVARERMLVKS